LSDQAGRFLGIGPVIATALRVRLSRRRCGLARGLRRSRWLAGLVRSKRGAQHRVQPSGGRRSPQWSGCSLLPRGRAGVVAALRGAAYEGVVAGLADVFEAASQPGVVGAVQPNACDPDASEGPTPGAEGPVRTASSTTTSPAAQFDTSAKNFRMRFRACLRRCPRSRTSTITSTMRLCPSSSTCAVCGATEFRVRNPQGPALLRSPPASSYS
jgi:hypothetical protein